MRGIKSGPRMFREQCVKFAEMEVRKQLSEAFFFLSARSEVL